MISFIMTAREHHRVKSAEEYLSRHTQKMNEKARRGSQFRVHEDPEPLTAYVNGGNWIVRCSCGAGNATDPQWRIACCYGCGAIHRTIAFPPSAALSEGVRLLLDRPVANRNWEPGETVDDLRRENDEHGLLREMGQER